VAGAFSSFCFVDFVAIRHGLLRSYHFAALVHLAIRIQGYKRIAFYYMKFGVGS
jgi:hypothetical protein